MTAKYVNTVIDYQEKMNGIGFLLRNDLFTMAIILAADAIVILSTHPWY